MSSEIQKKGSENLVQLPAHLQRPAGQRAEGFGEMEAGDYTLPRLALCQSNTPARKRSEQAYIPGLDDGQYFNTITKTVYGEHVKIVPLFFWKTRILFTPDLGGLKCQSVDNIVGVGDPGGNCAACPLAQFGSSEKEGSNAPACLLFYNYPVLVIPEGKGAKLGMDCLAVLSLKSTALRVAKDWNALMRLRNMDTYGGIYSLTAAEQKRDKQSWYVPIIKPVEGAAGFVTAEQFEMARQASAAVAALRKAGTLKVDAEDLNDTEHAGGGTREPGEDDTV